MGIVVNIRGGNGAGKSTAVRKFIEMHPASKIVRVDVNGQTSEVTELNGGTVYVLGGYEITSPGCDRYSGKAQITTTILTLIEREKPKAIVFEGLIFSLTANATIELVKKLSDVGWEYRGILFRRPFGETIEMIEHRNDGRNFDAANVLVKWERAIRSAEILNRLGIRVARIDTDSKTHTIEDAANTIWNAVYGEIK